MVCGSYRRDQALVDQRRRLLQPGAVPGLHPATSLAAVGGQGLLMPPPPPPSPPTAAAELESASQIARARAYVLVSVGASRR